MQKYFTLLLFTLFSLPVAGQNITVIVKRKCEGDKVNEAKDATEKFKRILDQLADEGKVINATTFLNGSKHREFFVVENESQFSEVYSEYETRIAKNYPEALHVFAEVCKDRKDTIDAKPKLYPVVRSEYWSLVVPVSHIDERPDPKVSYNIVSDFTMIAKVDGKDTMDSTQVSWGLAEVGRLYNLHVAAGIPVKKINFVLAIHGWSVFSFLNNDEYQKKYKIDNPNIRIIKELSDAGVKFLVCGQAMNWMNIEKSMLLPQTKVTLTAQTTLTSYQLKGYVAKPLKND